ncbi:MAG: ABC transporter ATP-binding protein [Clostridia bacterium]|nr:ABC transporter ATP-binding protein [Clostridia bacterium]
MEKLRRFLAYYRPHLFLFILDLTCALVVAAVDVAFPLVTQYLLRTLLPAMALNSALVRLFVLLIGCLVSAYLIRAALQYIIGYWGHRLGTFIEADMRRDIFTHIQTLPFSFYDGIRTGKLLSRVTNDLFEVTELAHHGPEDVLISTMTILGAFIAMFSIEWRLALCLLILLPVIIYFVMHTRLKMRRTSRMVKERMAEINADIESSISGARTAKAFANETYEIQKFEKGNKNFLSAKKDFYKVMAIFNSGTEFFLAMFNVAVLACGGYLIYKKQLDTVTLITFTLYISTFTSPIKRLASFAEQYMIGMAGFTRFLEIMDTKPAIEDKPDALSLSNVQGDIAFSHVSFAYNEGQQVLRDVNLSIPAGQTLALVGPSGGGKTTLCHLLLRFYDIRDGSITIDGHDIRDVTMRSLRENVGIVQQDVFLFADTILENIRYGRLDATDAEVVEAAKRAHIHEEIMTFPDGYATNVGERGMLLSGGQKQCVSIARLFLKNPPVLILDEATSALDTMTEADIQHSFDELSQGRTTLVIAHRLSTVQNADEIVVIDEHGIQERGTHEELLAKKGLYAGFYQATLRG